MLYFSSAMSANVPNSLVFACLLMLLKERCDGTSEPTGHLSCWHQGVEPLSGVVLAT